MKFKPLSPDCTPTDRQHVLILLRSSVDNNAGRGTEVYPRVTTAVALCTDNPFGGKSFYGFLTCVLAKGEAGLYMKGGTVIVGPVVAETVEAWAPIELP